MRDGDVPARRRSGEAPVVRGVLSSSSRRMNPDFAPIVRTIRIVPARLVFMTPASTRVAAFLSVISVNSPVSSPPSRPVRKGAPFLRRGLPVFRPFLRVAAAKGALFRVVLGRPILACAPSDPASAALRARRLLFEQAPAAAPFHLRRPASKAGPPRTSLVKEPSAASRPHNIVLNARDARFRRSNKMYFHFRIRPTGEIRISGGELFKSPSALRAVPERRPGLAAHFSGADIRRSGASVAPSRAFPVSS